MRKKITALLTGLVILPACANIALAVEIPISITIPAVSGVTVPLIEEQTIQSSSTPAQENKTALKDAKTTGQLAEPVIKEKEKTTTMIEQQIQQEKVLIFVKTFYER